MDNRSMQNVAFRDNATLYNYRGRTGWHSKKKNMPILKHTFTAAELTPGKFYRVMRKFKDYDAYLHPAGEQWRFIEKGFLPYEDGLSLMVERQGQKVTIRLQWREEAQAEIIENFSDFVEEV
jgi:hypothetical protein